MFPFWDLAIQPVLEAARAKRVVEIGALRGETTAFMLEGMGPDVELHVIDPVPVFDPSEHERQFPGRYIFHRALSHEVLGDLPPMDAALIDGDHNWYTVYHELRMLSDVARKEGHPLPLMILHDVGWPYGRRDLYYAPEQIPEEFRQPYARGGMLPGRSELLEVGGLNPTMYNADHEGGPRNGVMTAVDDFIEEYDRPVRLVYLPVYFGLAIVVEEAQLAVRPALVERLDWLESAEGQAELVGLAERVRIDSLVVQHGVFFTAEERVVAAADHYLDLLKGALLNEHYLEHEVRLGYLVACVEQQAYPRTENLRDPGREHTDELERLRVARRIGSFGDTEGELPHVFPFTSMGRTGLDHLQSCLETVRTEDVGGDLVACGAGRGGGAIFLRAFLETYGVEFTRVWVADPFRARPPGVTSTQPTSPEEMASFAGGRHLPDLQGDVNIVREGFERFGVLDERVRFVQGDYDSALPAAPIEKVALLHIGGTASADVGVILDRLYDKVTLGGFVVIEDLTDPEVRAQVESFRARRGVTEPIERIDWAGAAWRKTVAVEPSVDAVEPVAQPAGPPLAPARGWFPTDLTVVVVFYNMKREAARTLHSLSRAYQRDLGDLTYEVIAVDNGSAPDQKLGEEYVRSFGKEFRYIDMGDDATSSPVPALNRGIAEGQGINYALMIDGAHVLTPGVLHFGMLGLRTYQPAVVATQQWYLGPGQQPDLVDEGYDKVYEDTLFDQIRWPTDGYQLFDIGHFIGERDWFDGLWESNCLFVERTALEQAGCFDERWSMPGGGYANLDIFERIGATPGVTVATILGEGSFHQVHGGTTTNLAGEEDRHFALAEYLEHYEETYGRGFRGNAKPLHFVGTMPLEAARTKARRRVAPNLFLGAAAKEPGGVPQTPEPLPQDLQAAFLEAYWNTLKWRQTEWLGRRMPKLPTDLFAYQEILYRVRPDWIIETGTMGGGRALFLASICDLLGHGQVLSVDKNAGDGLPEHERITYLAGPTHHEETLARVKAVVGEQPHAVVILGTRGTSAKMSAEFHGYEEFVPTGSYLIMEDTIVGGHPVWGNFGLGPFESVKGITGTRGDFASDRSLEKYGISFNPTGYLKRIR